VVALSQFEVNSFGAKGLTESRKALTQTSGLRPPFSFGRPGLVRYCRMPKRSRKEISDPNVSAANVLKRMFKQAEAEGKDPLAVALGRRGGLKGGRARADKLTQEERSESARKAAKARWKA
jgi:hypothetical protein